MEALDCVLMFEPFVLGLTNDALFETTFVPDPFSEDNHSR
jgi:hypothetical protein